MRRLTFLAAVLVLAVTPVLGAGPTALPPNLTDGWYATIETGLGTIVVRLLPEQAPQSVAHFAALAEGRLEWVDPLTGVTKKTPYYDGLEVHLALAAQRFEAGDPTKTGRGAPPIYVPLEATGPIRFNRPGRVGLTRASLGRINGALFFVTAAALSYLDGHHPCFGEVVAGQEVVSLICGVKTDPRGKPLESIRIERVRVHRVGEPKPLPEPVRYTPKPPQFGPKEPQPGP